MVVIARGFGYQIIEKIILVVAEWKDDLDEYYKLLLMIIKACLSNLTDIASFPSFRAPEYFLHTPKLYQDVSPPPPRSAHVLQPALLSPKLLPSLTTE